MGGQTRTSVPNIFLRTERDSEVLHSPPSLEGVVNSYRDVYRRSMRYVQFSHSTAYS